MILSEKTEANAIEKCDKMNDLGITVNLAFSASANVLSDANKARGMLNFITKFIYMTDEGYLYKVPRIRHLSKLSLPQKGHIQPRKSATDSNEGGERSEGH